MLTVPLRGPEVRRAGLPLPPQAMPGWRGRRPLKRWRYLGVYTPELMLCIGDARIGPVRRRWWAVAEPDGRLTERTTVSRGSVRLAPSSAQVDTRGVRIDLALEEPAAVETLSPAGGAYVWTAKRAPVAVEGTVDVDGRRFAIAGPVGVVDDSAGYHDRHTAWRWSAGVGVTRDGVRVAWNLVDGIHDGVASERTLWVDGAPTELGPNRFAADLSWVGFAEGGRLEFSEWSRRSEDSSLGLLRSRYDQPFGTFTGTLPGGLEVMSGCGVMEDHDVHW